MFQLGLQHHFAIIWKFTKLGPVVAFAAKYLINQNYDYKQSEHFNTERYKLF